DDLRARHVPGHHGGDAVRLLDDGVAVRLGEAAHGALLGARGGGGLREDEDDVGAQRGEARGDGVAYAGAQRHHHHHRRHAEEDAQDGQRRAQLAPGDGPERDAERRDDPSHDASDTGGASSSSTGGSAASAAWASWGWVFTVSLRTRPSRMLITRL